jgi:DTW domain-containing protein
VSRDPAAVTTGPMPEPGAARERCYACFRPLSLCLCSTLPSVPTRTRIVVLQHPHERTHPFGTARLVRLCMPNASVHVPCPGFSGTFAQPLDVPDDTAVLYPSADAVDLEDLPPDERPSTLLVVDGTWAHAKRVHRDNTWLHTRRHVRLTPSAPSRYRIRKEPRDDYVSTLEAIVEALRLLEPDNHRLDELLLAFDRMIDQQLLHRGRVAPNGRHKQRRQRPSRALPEALLDDRVVVCYGESSMPGGDPRAGRELVHWAAHRPADGANFEAVLRPAGPPPDDGHLGHMRLTRDELRAGEAPATASERFATFLAGGPVAAWTATTFAWGDAFVDGAAGRIELKRGYCNLAQRRAGYLEHVVRDEGLTPPALPCRGRAAVRLANAVAVARWLQGHARARAEAAPCD